MTSRNVFLTAGFYTLVVTGLGLLVASMILY